jgi:hypothetical protein
MMTVKTDLLMQVENILGALIYLVGVAGSYFRFGKYERRGKLDALFMICITWGYCSIMVGLMNIVKYTLVPSLHLEMIRVLYYGGAAVSSFVFFEKDFYRAATKSKIYASLLMGTMAFVFWEALVFYLDLPFGMAVLSCVGLLVIYIFNLGQRKNLAGILTGLAMLLMPILPKLTDGGLDLDKMSMKRDLAINRLIDDKSNLESRKNLIVESSDTNTMIK